MHPSDILFHSSLISMQIGSNSEDYFLAQFTHTAPPSPARWRKSDTDTAWTLLVCGVAGRDTPMVPSRRQIQLYLITQKVPTIQDDDFLAPITYTVHSTTNTKVEEARNRGGGDSTGGWDRGWRGLLGDGGCGGVMGRG